MKAKLLIGIFAGVLLCTAFAPAEEYYVRNRPFKQVVKVGSDAYVPVESFLRVLGYNWNVQAGTVVLTTGAGRNPEISAGSLKFKMGDQTETLEVAPRGGSNYVALKPLARFLGYNVTQTANGIVDVNRGHLSTDNEKTAIVDASKAKEEREKAIKEAWEKKAAELKEKREAKEKDKDKESADADDKDKDKAEGDQDKEKDKEKVKDKEKDKDKSKSKDKGKTAKSKDKEKETATASDADKSKESASSDKDKDKDKDKKKDEPPAAPRLEVFSTDANPDYSTGVVTIKTQVKNQGNGQAKSVSGTLTVIGPDQKVWYTTHVRGPGLAPDAAWDYETTYRHRLGSSMPHGPIKVQLKLD